MKMGMPMRFMVLAAVLLLTAMVSANRSWAQEGVLRDQAVAVDSLTERLQIDGALSLVVELALPGYDPAAFDQVQAAAIQEVAIAAAQNAMLRQLGDYEVSQVQRYPYVPVLAFTLHSTEALELLRRDPAVVHIQEDILMPPLLDESVPLVQADAAHGIFYTGAGQTVAVLDTGVDKSHPALAGKVVSEACYSTPNAAQGFGSLCPGGVASSTQVNSGLGCSATVQGCDHGTHVAGIVAGMAPQANLISIQVFRLNTDGGANNNCANANRTSPCVLSSISDQVAALNRVYALRNSFNIAAVNMSLGSGNFPNSCDNDTRKSSIELLRGAGIATVIAAGNSSFVNAMGQPACISGSISVGATEKNDVVSTFSNLNPLTTLLAPGGNINSTIFFDSFQPKSGTSMAAPHVAGAVAVLKQALPSASVTQIRNALSSTGPLIADTRAGGTVSKRRLNLYLALCALITCDSDDYRYLAIPQTVNGSVSQINDRDHYFLYSTAGTRVTIQMNRSSGNLDAYLELYDPTGVRVALNNNGGGDLNALINNYTLLRTGRYQLVARSAGSNTGGYSISVSAQAVEFNPIPSISSFSPSSATGTLTGADFWVQINGSGFTSQSEAYWNNALRTSFYSSPTRMWIRVRGSDLGLPWPRTATIRVRNPQPGGGYSNPRSFSVTFPFLGTSELVTPDSGATVLTGVQSSFVISWTHPDSSWRTMQNMDLRLRDQNNRVAAWIRVVERPGTDSTYRLLNGAEAALTEEGSLLPDEGLPGENRTLSITDTVTLHLADSQFSGSGQTAIMTPTVSFGPNAVGVYNIEFRVDSPDGEVQDDDVLGQITIVPAECPLPVNGVTVSGPESGQVNTDYIYTANVIPLNATQPISYTWSPEPKSGQGTASATYNFGSAREEILFLGVENCGSFVADLHTVRIQTTAEPDLAIDKTGPATLVAGEAVTYTLTVTNSGATTATDLVVTDVLPEGATYIGGGMLTGNSVRWDIPTLGGYGAVTETTYVVSAASTITNSAYAVSASGGYSATGERSVVSKLVGAQVDASALTTSTMSLASAFGRVEAKIPPGSVGDPTQLVMSNPFTPTQAGPENKVLVGAGFSLEAYQNNQLQPGFKVGEAISLTTPFSLSASSEVDAATLKLYAWDGAQWSAEGVQCAVDLSQKLVNCTADAPTLTQFALFADAPLVESADPTSVVLSEVYYTSNETGDWIELKNGGSEPIDVSQWHVCAALSCQRLTGMTVITPTSGQLTQAAADDLLLEPGAYLVLQSWTDLNNVASNLALYRSPAFENAAELVDFVQWGSADNLGRTDLAATKGIWAETSAGQYDFVPTAAAGESLALVSSNKGTASVDFRNGLPTQGRENSLSDGGAVKMLLYLPLVER